MTSTNSAWYAERGAARADDIRWMADTGENLIGAARRLGIGRDGLEKWCKNHGLTAELEQLRLRDPADLTLDDRVRAAGAAGGAARRWAS